MSLHMWFTVNVPLQYVLHRLKYQIDCAFLIAQYSSVVFSPNPHFTLPHVWQTFLYSTYNQPPFLPLLVCPINVSEMAAHVHAVGKGLKSTGTYAFAPLSLHAFSAKFE